MFALRFALGSFLSLEPDEVAETPLLHAGKWKWWTNVLLYQRSVTTKDPRRRSKSCNGSVVVQITEVGLGVTMSEHCCWNTDLAEAKMRLKAKIRSLSNRRVRTSPVTKDSSPSKARPKSAKLASVKAAGPISEGYWQGE